MNKIAYTGFVVFVTAILTLVVVHFLSSDSNSMPRHSFAPAGSASTTPVSRGEAAPNQERFVTLEELAQHGKPDDCWIAIRGKVYNITTYITLHPTPPSVLQKWCGQEATEAWETKGYGRPHGQVAHSRLAELLVGILAE